MNYTLVLPKTMAGGVPMRTGRGKNSVLGKEWRRYVPWGQITGYSNDASGISSGGVAPSVLKEVVPD